MRYLLEMKLISSYTYKKALTKYKEVQKLHKIDLFESVQYALKHLKGLL